METPFPAYSGDEPYVFVCYAHEDKAIVYPEIAWLREQGINIWYDEGISAGKVWRAEIARALGGASQILLYISQRSIDSSHCDREINFSLDHEKRIVPVYLELTKLSDDLELGLSRIQAINRYKTDAHTGRESIRQALQHPQDRMSALPSRRRNLRWAVGPALVATVFIVWLYLQNASPTLDSARVQLVVSGSSELGTGYRARGLYEQILRNLESYPDIQQLDPKGTAPPESYRLTPVMYDGELALQLTKPGGASSVRISVSTGEGNLPEAVSLGTRQLVEAIGQRYVDTPDYALDEALMTKYLRAVAVSRDAPTDDDQRNALADLQDVLRANPRYLPNLLELCRINLQLFINLESETYYSEAEKYCNRAVTLEPENPRVRRQLAEIYAASGLYSEAISLLTQITRTLPYDVGSTRALGAAFMAVDEMELAENYFLRAVELEPGLSANHSELGSLYLKMGIYSQATAAYEQAWELDQNAYAANNLAAGYFYQGLWEKAGNMWQRSLAMDETSGTTLSNIGTTMFLSRNFESATDFYIRAVEYAPERFGIRGNLGESQYFACDTGYRDSLALALEFAATQIRLNPTYVEARSRSAVFHAYLGDVDRADELIHDVLQMAPDNINVAYDQAVVWARLGRDVQTQQAIARLRRLGYDPRMIESDASLRLDQPVRDGELCFLE
ncbi:MAG: tetratricopeptide (TPR) repeat protein [Candidatus Azotimanducaceae bacterium]